MTDANGRHPPGIPPLRVAVALGNPERERRLLAGLDGADGLLVAERCLAADDLLACVRAGRADALLVAHDVHRLGADALDELRRARLPLVLLAPDDVGASVSNAVVLPPDAEAGAVREALHAAARGDRTSTLRRTEAAPAPATPRATAVDGRTAVSVLAVAGGHGSPGRTTLALNLAAGLGSVEPTLLVDADLTNPSVAAYLDADPTRNLYMLAHAEPDTAGAWERAVAQEAQPLHPRSAHGAVLCGVPKPEMRAAVTRRFLERLVDELRHRYRYVVLDLGADLLGPDALVHRTALGLADRVLLVASADLVGLAHARTALGQLDAQLGIGRDRVAVVINRHDTRYHHSREEIEWGLDAPTAAVVPHDHGAAQRAIAAQRPMVLDDRSRAGWYLLEFAGRVHGGRIELPPEPREQRPGLALRALSPARLFRRRRPTAAPAAGAAITTGAPDGDRAAAVP